MLLNAHRELAWIARHWKAIPIPALVYDPHLDQCGQRGQYLWPTKDVARINGCEMEISNGAIVLGCDPGPGTLAHEFRHHLQYHARGSRWRFPNIGVPVREYFECPFERDALEFELRFAPESRALYFAEVCKVVASSRAGLLSRVQINDQGPIALCL